MDILFVVVALMLSAGTSAAITLSAAIAFFRRN